MSDKKNIGFNFQIEASLYLSVDEIWPDGDAPENPTADDVAQVIEQCGGLRAVIRDWDLDQHVSLTIDGNNTMSTVRS